VGKTCKTLPYYFHTEIVGDKIREAGGWGVGRGENSRGGLNFCIQNWINTQALMLAGKSRSMWRMSTYSPQRIFLTLVHWLT